jgi:hypothetical protein
MVVPEIALTVGEKAAEYPVTVPNQTPWPIAMPVAEATVKLAPVAVMLKADPALLTTLGIVTVMVVVPAAVMTAGYCGELISVPGIS